MLGPQESIIIITISTIRINLNITNSGAALRIRNILFQSNEQFLFYIIFLINFFSWTVSTFSIFESQLATATKEA